MMDLQLREIPNNLRITFMNGINTTSKEALSHSKRLSNFSGGYNIFIAYNETYNVAVDAARAKKELFDNYESKAVKLLKNEWINYLSQNKSNRTLHICHSKAAYIDAILCNLITHVKSKNDFVPLFDSRGLKQNIATTITLTSHPDAKAFDHNFDSPTYIELIDYRIKNFIKLGEQ